MFTRVLFALSILAVIALLWAGISMAQHVRRARRRRRRAQRADFGMRSGVLALPDRPAAVEAGFAFAELTPYSEAAVSRVESPSAQPWSWTTGYADPQHAPVETQPAGDSRPIDADPEPVAGTPVHEPTYKDDPQFAEFLNQIDERLPPRSGPPEIFADGLPSAAPSLGDPLVSGFEALFGREQVSSLASSAKVSVRPSSPIESIEAEEPVAPLSAIGAVSSQMYTSTQSGAVSFELDAEVDLGDEESSIHAEPEILFRTLNIVREPAAEAPMLKAGLAEPEPLVAETTKPEDLVPAATFAPSPGLTEEEIQAAEEPIPEIAAETPSAPQPSYAALPKPPQSALPKPTYARLGKKLARPDWEYFNKDMGDLTDPYESPRTRSKERTGT